MKILKMFLALIPLALLAANTAFAHHSIAAIFKQQERMTITGEVEEFLFVNPHANLRIRVTDEDGNQSVWDVEMDGRLNLTNGNITPETFTPGEKLTVLGFPPHVQSTNLFFLEATREDGTVVLPPRGTRGNSLEEARRLRRLQQEGSE